MNHLLDGIQIRLQQVAFLKGDIRLPIVTYLRMSALPIVRLPPRANVPAQRTR